MIVRTPWPAFSLDADAQLGAVTAHAMREAKDMRFASPLHLLAWLANRMEDFTKLYNEDDVVYIWGE